MRGARSNAYSGPVCEIMLKTRPEEIGAAAFGQAACANADSDCAKHHAFRPRIALLSNPKSTGNLAKLPAIREFAADHPDLFHYEVEHAGQVAEALRTIARIRPKVLAINGGDGTVQAALTEIHNGGHFGEEAPPVAVLPSGKTNLIALDLGSQGDPVVALQRLIDMAQDDLSPYLVPRELIALRHGPEGENAPVIGMFLGGAALAETMLYCREKIYPLGLPNGIAHVLTATAAFLKAMLGLKADFLPSDSKPLSVSLSEQDRQFNGRFSLLIVTTLDKLLMSTELESRRQGRLKLLAIEEHPSSLMRALGATILGKLGRARMRGIHLEESDEITIEGESSHVILDGETFRAEIGSPIRLRPAQPLSFVKLAA